jgi:hypothetical protein
MRRLRSLLSVAVLALTASACAQDLGVIDRTQPGLLDKRVFQGEWYFMRTVVDVPYTTGFTFVGENEELERVRWEITEDRLVAYRAYDFVAGTDLDHAKRARPGDKVTGQPVAIYRIVGHFDVNRTYSEATGEQSNVLVENAQDRPWFERKYMRVDWSDNSAKNDLFTIDNVATQPVKWAITDPTHPDSLTLGWRDDKAQNGTGWAETRDPTAMRARNSAEYLDFVTKVLASPGVYVDEDWGWSAPVCWFYLNEDCKPAEITVRTSLRKVDPANDYEPMEYPDNYVARDKDGKIIKVQEFADGSCAYDDKQGKPLRIPLFDKFGFFRAERFGYDKRYGEVESARRLMISRWNLWQQSKDGNGKAIPMKDRKPKPVVYYTGAGLPPELDATLQSVGKEWDAAFRDVVAAVQGKDAGTVPKMFDLRHNTVKLDKNGQFVRDASGHVVDRGQRVGDLRYSLLNLVTEPTRAGLLGYGPSATDPMTGETIAAWAHTYMGPTNELATTGRDMVRLANGDISPEQLGLGEVSEAAVQATLGKLKVEGAGGEAKTGAKAEIEQGKANGKAELDALANKVLTPERKKHVQSLKKSWMKGREGWAKARLELLAKHPELAARLVNRDTVAAFGSAQDRAQLQALPPGAPLPPMSQAQRDRNSPAAWAPLAARQKWLKRKQFLLKHNMTHAAFADDALLGLVEELKNDKDKPDVLWQKIREATLRSTALHEVGHTLGLRHNFEGSTDALNYHDQYWTLRGADGKPFDSATGEPQKPTEAQKKAGMDDWKYSSIMDYAQRFHHDLKGLGKYDRAALMFGYGGLVETFAKKPADPAIDKLPLSRLLKGVRHYTEIPKVIGSLAGIKDRKWVPYEQVIAERKVECQGEKKDRTRTLWEVPYRFCSDEYVEGTPTCDMYDHGADPFEIVRSNFSRYKDHYFLYAFRRDRVNFSVDEYAGKMQSWFMPVAIQYQNFVFDSWPGEGTPAGDWETLRYLQDNKPTYVPDVDWEKADTGGKPTFGALTYGIERLAQIVATPEPGSYCLDETTGLLELIDNDDTRKACDKPKGCNKWYTDTTQTCADAVIELGRARYDDTEFATETGYYFYDRLRHVGSFYDKVMALAVLTDPTTYFVGVDSSQAVNNYILPMNLYFAPELYKLFGALASGRQDRMGWVRNANGKVRERRWFGEEAKEHDKLPAMAMPDMFMLRDYAMYFGMAWFPSLLDQTFNDSMKVWLEGSGEAFKPADLAEVATFTNPLNSKVYHGVKMGDATVASPGWQMVKDAQGWAEKWLAKPGDGNLKYYFEDAAQWLELARGYYSVYGYAWF